MIRNCFWGTRPQQPPEALTGAFHYLFPRALSRDSWPIRVRAGSQEFLSLQEGLLGHDQPFRVRSLERSPGGERWLGGRTVWRGMTGLPAEALAQVGMGPQSQVGHDSVVGEADAVERLDSPRKGAVGLPPSFGSPSWVTDANIRPRSSGLHE